MLFNSFAFALFLPIVFAVYWWACRSLRSRNGLVLLASWFFYAWWDWRFLGLLILSTAGDYFLGLAISRTEHSIRRKWLLGASIGLNLGLLGFFKYFDFFIDGLADVIAAFGMQPHLPVLHVVLPVGISFYTFQTLSYAIDIYRRQLEPTRDFVAFAAFVSFFPQLVAGPIERAANLLPQFLQPRALQLDRAKDGLRQMLWGFFKKIAVADALAPLVDGIFSGDTATTPGITLFFGAFFFAFQIYCDFSGYSDIAIGCARLFGFSLSRNFNYPYFSRNLGEFWRRWHISLSTWFRDYLYIPLGGNRGGRTRTFGNRLVTFGVSGFWHGANWSFVGWGIAHGLLHSGGIRKSRITINDRTRTEVPGLRDLPAIMTTFLIVTLTWVLFRSSSLSEGGQFLWSMAANALQSPGAVLLHLGRAELILLIAMIAAEWRARTQEHALAVLPQSAIARWLLYLIIGLITLSQFDLRTQHAFIYFQF